LFLIFVPALTAKAECVKTMAWNDDYPYSFKKNPADNEPQGLNIESALAVFSELKCELRFAEMPFARALEELKQGRIDIIGSAYYTEDRQAFAVYSSIGFDSPNVLFLRRDDLASFNLQSLTDIQKKHIKLGAQIGVSYSEEYATLINEPGFSGLIQFSSDRKTLWRMLNLKRVDMVIADLTTGLAEIKQLGLKDSIVASGLIVSSQPAYFIFSKQSTDINFVKAFDAKLVRLEEVGTLKAIDEKYD
jgi:polar amino acid transport system substrate-binding protein